MFFFSSWLFSAHLEVLTAHEGICWTRARARCNLACAFSSCVELLLLLSS